MTTSSAVSRRAPTLLLSAVIIELTAATAYIHFTLGGTLFLLNALGYSVLAVSYALAAFVPLAVIQRFGWLTRVGLAGYTLVTIAAYVLIGPYFALGWIAKGIEVAIVGLLAVELLAAYGGGRGVMRAALRSLGLSFAMGLMAAALVACTPSTGQVGHEADADVEIVGRQMAFTPRQLTVGAGQPFTLQLTNEDAAPHNVAIYGDSSAAEALYVGELITSSAVTYGVPALAPGSYFFRCDVHPEMTGSLVVEDR